eukprot:m.160843 g.160843  ORF g.160843 m.160843 type:complete len:668 (-) comp11997_c0_seq1:258-2261(-)
MMKSVIVAVVAGALYGQVNGQATGVATCDFNSGTCGWTLGNRWRVDAGGSTPSTGTGPARGQAGTTTDNYAHIEASGIAPGTISYMTSPAFTTPAAGGFLSFYYHAYGNSIGTLAVQTCAGSSCADVYQSTGATHSSATAAWTLFQTRLPYGTTRVVITGVVGASFTGDISIDTITIGINPPASLLQTAFACDFNYPAATSGTAIRDFCGMSRNALWRVDTGGTTPSSSTGPSRGQAGTTTDNYAHIEVSTNNPAATVSTMETPQLNITAGAAMNFYYHMYGAQIGSLFVQSCARTTCTNIWNATGQQQTSSGAAWLSKVVQLPPGTTSARFVGIRRAGANSWQGDISVDTITITPNFDGPPCPARATGAFFSLGRVSPVKGCTGDNPTTATQGTCYTTNSGTCVSDNAGAARHINGEHCQINFLRSGVFSAQGTVSLESCCDYFRLFGSNTRLNTQAALTNVAFTAGSNMTWSSDASVTGNVWTLCASVPTPAPTAAPTLAPSAVPTTSPTFAPTDMPTTSPTAMPTVSPTAAPTAAPTASPTATPTLNPTAMPTTTPTAAPTNFPSFAPTMSPTQSPTMSPTTEPQASSADVTGGLGNILWIIIAAVAIILVAVIVAVVTKSKKAPAEEPHKTAFENPMYSDAHDTNAQSSYEGMSDGTGYMDVQ